MATHSDYMLHSDYYHLLHDEHGKYLPYRVAEKVCRQHGVELEGLVADKEVTLKRIDGTALWKVPLLPLMQALGY